MVSFAHSIRDDDICISEAHRPSAPRDGRQRPDLVSMLRASERANLAMHCYRKSHLRQIGLTIATTCDLKSLVQELGSVLGGAIFAQSRKTFRGTKPVVGRPRPAITLAACSAGGSYPAPFDVTTCPVSGVWRDSAGRGRSTVGAAIMDAAGST
jgi:hypothetical protein